MSRQLVQAPAAMTSVMASVTRVKEQPFRVIREEFIQDVQGSAALAVYSLPINPGLTQTFPWLSMIANAYDLYRFNKLRISYRTRDTSSDKGTVALAFEPNPDDPTPTNAQQIENFDTRVVMTPWVDGSMDVPVCDLNRLKKFLIRNSLVAAELATYDLGALYFGVAGTNTGKIGELWFEYDVSFYSPQPYDSTLTIPQPDSNSAFRQSAGVVVTTGNQTVIPWDTVQANPLGLTPTAGVFTGLRGALIVYAQVNGTPSASGLVNGGLTIQTSVDNGVTWNNSIFAVWPAGLSATSPVMLNAETLLQLLPSHSFRVIISSVGATVTAGGSAQNNILVLTPA